MRRVVLGLLLSGAVVVPAQASASVPPPNCGIVSCTYPIEKKLDEINESTQGVRDCVEAAKGAIASIVQGTPQPGECSP
jgi:hypothetical protein